MTSGEYGPNPISLFRESALAARCDFAMEGGFDVGWDAAMEVTRPIIEAAIATWRIIEQGSGYASVEGLGPAGINALQAANNWMAAFEESSD